jgi:transcription initiation factor IIE alpha subunit
MLPIMNEIRVNVIASLSEEQQNVFFAICIKHKVTAVELAAHCNMKLTTTKNALYVLLDKELIKFVNKKTHKKGRPLKFFMIRDHYKSKS